MEKKTFTLGLVQMSMSENADKNLKKAIDMTRQAVAKSAQVVVLPELFMGPYFCQRKNDRSAFDRAEPIPGPTTKILGELARELKIVLVGGSVFEKAKEKYFNTASIFGPDGKMLGTYRKSHIPHDKNFYEKNYFSPGNTGIRVFETPFGKIAPGVCYDQWSPEFARIAALRGAELIVYPTAISNVDGIPRVDKDIPEDWEQHWRGVQVGHAGANNVYVAAVNRVGREGKSVFWGGSFVVNPGGIVIAQGGDREEIVYAKYKPSYVHKMQKAWGFFPNRRPDLYGDLTKKQ